MLIFDRDVETILLHRAEQLDRKITHALAGELPLAEAPAGTLNRIYPVICLLDGFPIGFPPTERIRKRVNDEGYLQQLQSAPLTIASVEDLENLFALVESGSLLTDVLKIYSAGVLAEEPLHDFFGSDQQFKPRLPAVLEAAFDDIGSRLKQQLFPD